MSYQQWIASIGARFFFPLQLSIPSDHFNHCQRIGRHWARCSQACVLNNEYYAFFPSKINLKLTWFQINPSVVFGRELLLLQTFPDCRFVLYWHGSRFLFQARPIPNSTPRLWRFTCAAFQIYHNSFKPFSVFTLELRHSYQNNEKPNETVSLFNAIQRKIENHAFLSYEIELALAAV